MSISLIINKGAVTKGVAKAFLNRHLRIKLLTFMLVLTAFASLLFSLLPEKKINQAVSSQDVYGATIRNRVDLISGSNHDICFLYIPSSGTDKSFATLSPDYVSDYVQNTNFYEIYLTGEEIFRLVEGYVSFKDKLNNGSVYIGGLSYEYASHRVIMNKVISVSTAPINEYAVVKEAPLDNNRLYKILCDFTLFNMAGYLDYRSQGLMSIVPKNSAGIPVTADLSMLTPDISMISSISNTNGLISPVGLSNCIRYEGLNLMVLIGSTNVMGIYVLGLIGSLALVIIIAAPIYRRYFRHLYMKFYTRERKNALLNNRLAYFR